MKKENQKREIVVISRDDAIPGKFFEELEILIPAEVGIGYHGTRILKNVKIKEVQMHFNAVGPGSVEVSRVIVSESEQAGN